ncbi:hypothetical protein FLBR109950_08900 [Flavobacterium branchiophilum]|uniref:Uncharacterized protein n=1 Tax=Flavobacterium branchiophilum (strain FL-15) TaxID=1034807 RepID=G2Z7N0_FLABF|nr:hypothetical protein [Flavobacterium branchiophilum]CCB69152.1 Protein of unknown function precursor [Flavobacterium branchiophilum FL-15]
MKNIFYFYCALFIGNVYAQTHQIQKHNGETFLINYIKTDENLIHYTWPNQNEHQVISNFAVATLTHISTSKSHDVSTKMEWNAPKKQNVSKVIKCSETHGLTPYQTISVFLGRPKGISDTDFTKLKHAKLHEKAKLHDAPFVCIIEESFDEVKALLFRY